MLRHLSRRITQPTSTGPGVFFVVNMPWYGVGGMIATALSWLPDLHRPFYLYGHNAWYGYPDARTSLNHFDWYFDQVLLGTPYSVHLGYRHPNIPLNTHLPRVVITPIWDAVRDRLVIKPELLEVARRQLPDPERTLAIHYRGTDKHFEIKPTPLPDLFSMIERELSCGQYKHLLFCTDDQSVLDAVKHFNPIYFPQHIRATGDAGVHMQARSYQHALEAFVEILAMGMCRKLICGRSSVADSAIMLARNQQFEWSYHN